MDLSTVSVTPPNRNSRSRELAEGAHHQQVGLQVADPVLDHRRNRDPGRHFGVDGHLDTVASQRRGDGRPGGLRALFGIVVGVDRENLDRNPRSFRSGRASNTARAATRVSFQAMTA